MPLTSEDTEPKSERVARMREKARSQFARTLRAWIAYRRTSQTKLADASGLSRQIINDYAQQKRLPDPASIQLVADALDVTFDVLNDGHMPPLEDARVAVSPGAGKTTTIVALIRALAEREGVTVSDLPTEDSPRSIFLSYFDVDRAVVESLRRILVEGHAELAALQSHLDEKAKTAAAATTTELRKELLKTRKIVLRTTERLAQIEAVLPEDVLQQLKAVRP